MKTPGNVHLSTVFVPKVDQIIMTLTEDVPKKPLIIFGTGLYQPTMDIPETFIRWVLTIVYDM